MIKYKKRTWIEKTIHVLFCKDYYLFSGLNTENKNYYFIITFATLSLTLTIRTPFSDKAISFIPSTAAD